MTYYILKLIILTIFIIIIYRIFEPFFIRFGEYMLNKPNAWYDKKIEKPRLLFHIFAAISMSASYLSIQGLTGLIHFNGWELIRVLTAIIFLLLGIFILISTWTKKFENQIISFLNKNNSEKNFIFIIKKDIDINIYCEKYVGTGNNRISIAQESLEDFKLFLTNQKTINKIKWIHIAHNKKDINYQKLFDLLDEIIIGGFKAKDGDGTSYLDFVTNNFIMGDLEEHSFKINIPGRYSKWKNKDKNKNKLKQC
jgi:hypothetical protein